MYYQPKHRVKTLLCKRMARWTAYDVLAGVERVGLVSPTAPLGYQGLNIHAPRCWTLNLQL